MPDGYSATVYDTGNRIFRWEVQLHHGTAYIEGSGSCYILRARAERKAERWANKGKKQIPVEMQSFGPYPPSSPKELPSPKLPLPTRRIKDPG